MYNFLPRGVCLWSVVCAGREVGLYTPKAFLRMQHARPTLKYIPCVCGGSLLIQLSGLGRVIDTEPCSTSPIYTCTSGKVPSVARAKKADAHLQTLTHTQRHRLIHTQRKGVTLAWNHAHIDSHTHTWTLRHTHQLMHTHIASHEQAST